MSEVNLIATLNGKELTGMSSTDLSVYGALGCIDEKSSLKLFEEDKDKDVEKKKKGVLQESAGRGHGSVLDQNGFAYSIEETTRATTYLLCSSEYLMHLQQSQRRTKARDYFLPETVKKSELNAEKVFEEVFQAYDDLIDAGIPEEDARMVLPLYVKNNIQTWGNARELMHVHSMSQREGVPSETSSTVDSMMEEGKKQDSEVLKRRKSEYYDNYETLSWFPASQLYSKENKTLRRMIKREGDENTVMIDRSSLGISEEEARKAFEERDEAELANLKHVHFTFLSPMSLATFHQATRQRTWNQSVEPIYEALERNDLVIPPTVQENGEIEKFLQTCQKLVKLYRDLVDNGIEESEAVGVVPHALQIYDLIHINGWNAGQAIGKRTCLEAQWEIRKRAMEMAFKVKEEEPAIAKYAEPQGRLYGECPEDNDCNYCFTETSLEELYDKLY